MERYVFFCTLVIINLLTIGCSATLPRVANEIPIINSDDSPINRDKNQTKLVIFNTAHPLLYPLTGRMNVYLNGKGIAQLGTHEYVQLIVPQGKYQVDLLHHDIFSFFSSHTIELAVSETYLEVYPTIISNGAQMVPKLPEGFWKRFAPAKSRKNGK